MCKRNGKHLGLLQVKRAKCLLLSALAVLKLTGDQIKRSWGKRWGSELDAEPSTVLRVAIYTTDFLVYELIVLRVAKYTPLMHQYIFYFTNSLFWQWLYTTDLLVYEFIVLRVDKYTPLMHQYIFSLRIHCFESGYTPLKHQFIF